MSYRRNLSDKSAEIDKGKPMPLSEQEKADLAKKRGAAAAQISDPEQRRKFIAAQGDAEAKGKGNADPDAYRQMDKEADDTLATGGLNKATNTPTYHKGTDYVPKTGKAVLKKGEAVLEPEAAKHYRATMSALAGKDAEPEDKPAKKIKEIRVRKGKSGGHIIEHHHTHAAHPMEEHVVPDMAALKAHMEQNMGDAEPDADDMAMPSVAAAAQAGGQ